MFEIFMLMLVGHAVCDYPLQGEWLAKAKDPVHPLLPGQTIWPSALAAHAGIHAGAVLVATGSLILAALEFFAHAGIDYAKCSGRLSFNQDQTLHVLCKFVWLIILAVGVISPDKALVSL
jgi:hypothetical protein